jgi:hypothetical protein
MISLFSFDEQMVTCNIWSMVGIKRTKRSNNLCCIRDKITEKEFKKSWLRIENSGSENQELIGLIT